jgi:LysM repeat protein
MTFNDSSFRDYKKNQKKKQSLAPLIMGGFAIIFIGIGFTLIFLWNKGADSNLLAFLNTETPTNTPSPTDLPPTETPTATLIPSETPLPTETLPPTPAEPFAYVVQSGDSLFLIAEEFLVDYISIMVMNGLTNESVLFVGDELIIPNPDMEFPTATPYPEGATEIEYFVLPGDTGKIIADKFFSTLEDIEAATILFLGDDSFDINLLYPGQIIIVPVNITTPVPTFAPTETVTP